MSTGTYRVQLVQHNLFFLFFFYSNTWKKKKTQIEKLGSNLAVILISYNRRFKAISKTKDWFRSYDNVKWRFGKEADLAMG